MTKTTTENPESARSADSAGFEKPHASAAPLAVTGKSIRAMRRKIPTIPESMATVVTRVLDERPSTGTWKSAVTYREALIIRLYEMALAGDRTARKLFLSLLDTHTPEWAEERYRQLRDRRNPPAMPILDFEAIRKELRADRDAKRDHGND